MKFRIYPNDLDDIPDKLYKSKLAQYEKHLSKHYPEMPGDLWCYFAWNFFHDGEISKIELGADFQTVSLDITGPNIRWYKDGYKPDAATGEFEYMDAQFCCVFSGVKYFEIAADGDDPDSASQFQYCEIDSLTEKIEEAQSQARDPDDADAFTSYHSLIISTADGRTITLTFSDLDVIAMEPLAFDMMLHDPHYHVPLAEPPAI